MDLKPLKKYNPPGYPNKLDVSTNPMLLKNVPKRWQSKVLTGILFSAFAGLLLSGCNNEPGLAGEALPPPFMTEEEAYTIIIEEAKSAGIELTRNGPVIKNIKVTCENYQSGDQPKIDKEFDLGTDLFDNSKKIAFEFMNNNNDYTIDDSTTISVSEGYDKAAKEIQEQINNRKDEIKAGIFYDPQMPTKEESEGLLRQQVKDFISWLKAQGII